MRGRFSLSVDELRRLLLDVRLTHKQIAPLAGCSPAAVAYQCKRLGLTTRAAPLPARPTSATGRRSWNSRDYDADALRAAVDAGETHELLAGRLGVSRRHVGELCRRFGIQPQRRGPRGGAGHPNWRGGSMMDADGYRLVWAPDHPHATKNRIREHRLVMERVLGRVLLPSEVVHHRNGVNDDNRPENLEVFASNADHLRAELTGRIPNWTPEGRARTLDGVRQAAANRRRSAGGDPPSPQTTAPRE